MPKQKTHSGVKKRFRVTKSGKILHRRVNRNHLLEKKSARRKRRLAGDGQLTGGDARQVRRLLGE
jgi:large subunit ribosomal protein L35